MGKNHILNLLKLIRALNFADILFKLLMHQVRHVVNTGALGEIGKIEALA